MDDYITFKINKEQTILNFLKSFYLSKTNIYKLDIYNLVFVNNVVLPFSYILNVNDILTIKIKEFEKSNYQPWNYPINIIYEDDDIIILNKPIEMLVHPDGSCNQTLANALCYYYQKQGINRQLRHIHRLDYDTSGIIVFAKHILAHSYLNYQMENGKIDKTYLAVLNGYLNNNEGILDFNIGKDRHHSNRYIVNKNGKNAITKYKVLKRKLNKTLVEIKLETGRTHQIRVHFSYIKHPLIGDKIYGCKDERLMLHAYKISFMHPRFKKIVNYSTPIPKGFIL